MSKAADAETLNVWSYIGRSFWDETPATKRFVVEVPSYSHFHIPNFLSDDAGEAAVNYLPKKKQPLEHRS